MASTIQIKVQISEAEALAALAKIEAKLNGLPESKKINIQFTGTNLKAYADNLERITRALKPMGQNSANISSTAAAISRRAEATRQEAKATEELAQAAKKATQETEKLKKSQGSSGQAGAKDKEHSLLWQLENRIKYTTANAILQGINNSLRTALTTMREVDKELVSIQKVTNMTDGEIKKLGEGAYSTASKYGIGAQDYLESIGTFSKAGYQELAEGLGELAVKTQLVGDVSAETASQFLLSTDAAFKYNGSVQDLSAVLDKANAVENNYATSIEKIAEGMPIVANVAAMAGMSMEETIAMLGTITAVTQESGSKAATAARALILNIMGDTTTEIEEGVTLTTEQVDSMSDILWKYSREAMEAAKATGGIVNPLEAIAGLSKAAKEGLLTEAELATMVSALGGKLRTNQLMALIENFDMFEDMLETMGGATGSADQEVGTMLTSWDSKVNILKNSWTELVSSMVDTGAIKGALDGVIGLVGIMNTDLGQTAVSVGLVSSALAVLGKGGSAALKALQPLLTGGKIGYGGWATLAVAGITIIATAIDALTVSYDEAREKAEALHTEMERDFGAGSRYDELISKQEELNALEERELWLLEQEKALKEEEARQADIDEYEKWQRKEGATATLTDVQGFYTTRDKVKLDSYLNELAALNDAFANLSISESEYIAGLGKIAVDHGDYVEQIRKYSDMGMEGLSESQINMLESYDMLVSAGTKAEESIWSTLRMAANAQYRGEGLTNAQALEQSSADINALMEKLQESGGTEKIEFEDNSSEAISNAENVKEAADSAAGTRDITYNVSTSGSPFPRAPSTHSNELLGNSNAGGTDKAPGGPALVNELGPELISANGLAYIAGGGEPTITNLPRGAIVLTAEETKRALSGQGGRDFASKQAGRAYALGKHQYTNDGGSNTSAQKTAEQEKNENKQNYYYQAAPAAPAGPNFEELEKELGEALDNLDLQIKLAQNRNDEAKEVELQTEAAKKIKDLVETYRKAGYSETSNEILTLLNKGYGYSDDIMEKLISSIEAAVNATDAANELEERRLDMEEAQTALANAEKQRSVRVFNAETGQWEWIADQSKVQSAKERLEDAEKSYEKEQQNQLLDQLRDANLGDLGDLVLGEGILANLKDDPELLKAFANALGAASGAADKTADASGESIFKSSDSHDTIYEFPGGITLTEEEAAKTTLKELAEQLRVLKLA